MKIYKILNKIRKTFFQRTVKLRSNMNSRSFLQTGETALITASDRSEDFNSQRKPCILNRVDQRPGENKMTSKTHRLLQANICRAGAIMAQDNVTEFTSQTATDGIKGKILIICYNILYLFKIDKKGDSVLVLTEHGNKFVSFYSGIVGKIRERHCQNTGS